MVETPEFLRSIVVSVRVRLARNLAGFPFPSKMSSAHEAEVLHLVDEGLQSLDRGAYARYDLKDLKSSAISLLQEQYLISPALVKRKENRAVFLSSDKAVSIMVNEEDHLREQYFFKGFDLYKAYERLSALDDGLADVLDFAYDKKLGYLTACPSNLGTGMRASVMMFLPGLTWSKEIHKLTQTFKKVGMTIRGAFGEGSTAEGYLYQVSNERTLGLSEKEILEQVTSVTMNICNLELIAREEMRNSKEETEIRDRCLRSYGTLTHCALLDMSEFNSKIVDVRLGVVLGFFKARDLGKFYEFLDDMRPAAFSRNYNLEGESEDFYDQMRAETVGTVLPKLVQVIKRGR
ncbi:MAG: ATP--guanido phosphotransferase [Clostridia bacterium]|nr:ATP--guanido phosphotransferase [Clostridia bacterium]